MNIHTPVPTTGHQSKEPESTKEYSGEVRANRYSLGCCVLSAAVYLLLVQ